MLLVILSATTLILFCNENIGNYLYEGLPYKVESQRLVQIFFKIALGKGTPKTLEVVLRY